MGDGEGSPPQASASGTEKVAEPDTTLPGHPPAAIQHTGYYSSVSTPLVSPDKVSTQTHALADTADNVSQMGWLRWIVEIQNRLTVWWEKRDADERKQFKETEERVFMERKLALHKKTQDEFGNAKHQKMLSEQEKLARGNEYKAELQEWKALKNLQEDEWKAHGHELTMVHGKQQAENNRKSLQESFDIKAEKGREVKREEEQLREQLGAQQEKGLQERQQLVKELTAQKVGKYAEAMQYMFNHKKNAVKEVQDLEEKWKSMSRREREAFHARAAHNHEVNDKAKESMREVRPSPDANPEPRSRTQTLRTRATARTSIGGRLRPRPCPIAPPPDHPSPGAQGFDPQEPRERMVREEHESRARAEDHGEARGRVRAEENSA